MTRYYEDKLAAERLERCYEVAPPRIVKYLKAELEYVLEQIHDGGAVLELGCGYGRILPAVARESGLVIGIDTSFASLLMGRERLRDVRNCLFVRMDAARLAFRRDVFDAVICIQNGISAFHADRVELIRESVRVAKPAGIVLFSSYSDKIWEDRLHWFRLQSEEGLLGEIDFERTRDGVITCTDGFTATTVGPAEFASLTSGLDADVSIFEVDGSSVFCRIVPHAKAVNGA